MTAELVNLRRARKAKVRDGQAKQAAENRVLSGRTKSERVTTEATQAQAIRRLDGHRLIEGHAIASSALSAGNECDDA